ncbi:MAG: hypothetical protein ABL961_00815 [Vicinamibacterales bacterium]
MRRIVAVLVLVGFVVATRSTAAQPLDSRFLARKFVAPENAPSMITMTDMNEGGERMIVTGQVTDGSKPLAGVSIYVFQADAKGLYTTDGFNSDDRARLHGAMRTDATGRYRFETIRPAGYGAPQPMPAHVHYVVRAPKGYKSLMYQLWFEDDAAVAKLRADNSLFKLPDWVAIRPITRDSDGVWHTTRDVVLDRE